MLKRLGRGTILSLPAILCLLFLATSLAGSTYAQQTQPSNEPPGCWQIVPTPASNGNNITVTRFTSSPSGEMWALGSTDIPGGPLYDKAAVMRWGGSDWTFLPTLPITNVYSLSGIKVFAPDSIWVTGTTVGNQSSNPIVAQWNGTTWSLISIPSLAIPITFLTDIDGTSPSNLWLSGISLSGPHNTATIGMILHWDGSQFTLQVSTPETDYVLLNRVLAISENDVWAVGTEMLHWDGKQWTNTRKGNIVGEFQDIKAVSPNDIWLVGDYNNQPVVVHWDGQQWTRAATPQVNRFAQLKSVAARSSNDIWAAGSYDQHALLMHWDGRQWVATPDPVPGFSSSIGAFAIINGEFRAGGSRTLKASGDTSSLLMRHTAEPCPSAGPQKPLNPPVPLPGTQSRQFLTGKSASGIFLQYWQENGGLTQQGYPISDVFGEVSDLNGTIYTVQYFERAVFEFHPEKPAPYNVLLSQLGTFQYKQKYPNGAPNQRANRDPGTVLFKETGKHLGGSFLKYWQENGGLLQQGFPISEEFTEVSDLDGRPYTVQYFERAVFEFHPENKPPYNVLLSQLGHFRYESKYGNPQAAAGKPRIIANSVLPTTLHGGGHYLVWSDLRSGGYTSQTIYAYDAAQNHELPISQPMVQPDGLPLATNGEVAFWTRRDVDIRYLEGYSFKTNQEIRTYQPSSVSSPDFRRSDFALDRTTLYYSDNWTGHTGVFAQTIGAATERQLPKAFAGGGMTADNGALLAVQSTTTGQITERSLKLYRSSTGSVTTLASGIGGFTGYGVSGDNVVYSFYSTITDQTMYLYNMATGTRKVITLGAASNPVVSGMRVAWVRWPSAEAGESDGWKIEMYNTESGKVTTPASGLRAMPKNLVLLDNDKLAYLADNDLNTPGSELYILDLDPLP